MADLLLPGASGTERLTDDVAVLRAMLLAETAWVQAQAAVGLVPAEAHRAVARAAESLLGADEALAVQVATEASDTGNPVVPLVTRLKAALPGDAPACTAGAIHTGLTSQDVVDTALMLVTGAALDAVSRDLGRVRSALAGLAREHRSTPVLAWTLAQPAVPTTFGARAAGWLQAVAEAGEHLVGLPLPLAYGGAAGTLDAVPLAPSAEVVSSAARSGAPAPDLAPGLQSSRYDVVQAWGRALGLPLTAGPWHVTRFPVLRAGAALGEVCAALGTFASDVLGGVRQGELAEPAAPGRGASSTMAHKRNPVLSVLLRRSALAAPPLVGTLYTAAGLAVDERPDGAWHAEWPTLRDLLRHAAASAHVAAELAEGLAFDPEAGARNLSHHLGEAGAGRETAAAEDVVDRILARYA